MRRLVIGFAVLCVPAAASARTNRCIETGTVVGETRCTNFGAWWATERAVPLFGGLGAWTSFTQTPFAGTITREGQTLAVVDTAQLARGALRAHGGDIRVAAMVSSYFYIGFGWGLALGSNTGNTVESNGYRVALGSGVNMIDARVAPFFGVRAPLGRLSLRAEVAPSLQILTVLVRATDGGGKETAGSLGGFRFALEPRLAVDYWVTPDTTFSLWSSANALRPGDMAVGLAVMGHIRGFDGTYK
jgi:hypothetical protein